MLTIGDKFPDFSVKGVVSTNPANAFQDFTQTSDKGKWKLVFFWPKDFTFVCPTEIAGFGKLNGDFNDRDTVIYGVSTDSEFVHLAWRQNHADLKTLPFAMLADTNRKLSRALGILDEEEGVAKRATFLVDPEGIIRFVYVTDMSVGRNPAEVLGCWMRCRPTSSAPATGRRAKRSSRRPREHARSLGGMPRQASIEGKPSVPPNPASARRPPPSKGGDF